MIDLYLSVVDEPALLRTDVASPAPLAEDGIIPPAANESAGRELLIGSLFSPQEARDARLRILGQELNYVLLFCWDGFVLAFHLVVPIRLASQVFEVTAATLRSLCVLLIHLLIF